MALLPKREYCLICLLEEQYALRDQLEDLTKAMTCLLGQIEDLLVAGDHENALQTAKATLEKIYGPPPGQIKLRGDGA
jgi:hypothetical protein